MKQKQIPLMFVGDDEAALLDILEARGSEGDEVRGGSLHPTWCVLLGLAEEFDQNHDEGRKAVIWDAAWRVACKDKSWQSACDSLSGLDRTQEDDDRFLRSWADTWLGKTAARVYPKHMTEGAVLRRIVT